MNHRRPKSLPGTIRRQKRKRGNAASGRHNHYQVSVPKLVMALTVLLIAFASTISLLWFSLSMSVDENAPRRKMTVFNNPLRKELPPPRFLSLWPDDESAPDLAGIMVECHAPDCVPLEQPEGTERVLIVRPPGVFGDVLLSFIESYLEGSRLELIATTASLFAPFPDTIEYDVLIHVVTLPIQMEAFDILLKAAEPTKALLTGDDIVAVVQHLLEWHCRVASHARDTNSIVLTLDPTLSFPLKSEKKLSQLYNQTDIPLPRDALARKTMAYLEEGNTFWRQLLERSKNLRAKDNDLPARVNNMIKRIMPDGECPHEFPKFSTGWFSLSSSPVETLLETLWDIDIVSEGIALDEN